jgi:hypothetical protein
MSMPEPQVCEAPQQPAFQAFNDAEMCEMVKRFVPAQMFSTAVGLQQYGAGDIHKQTDAIAEQGIREVGGALTVLGSSLAHGVGNDGKAGYKMAESTVGTAGEIVDWGLENARPASIEEAVARANSGCLTHASHKADLNKFATPILLLKSSKYPKLRPLLTLGGRLATVNPKPRVSDVPTLPDAQSVRTLLHDHAHHSMWRR